MPVPWLQRRLSAPGPDEVEPVPILQTSKACPRRPGCASRRVACRKIPSKYRCRRQVYRLVTKCGWAGPVPSSFCAPIPAPKIRATHPSNPTAPIKVCRQECGFHSPSLLPTPGTVLPTRTGALSQPNRVKALAGDQRDSFRAGSARKGARRSGTESPSR